MIRKSGRDVCNTKKRMIRPGGYPRPTKIPARLGGIAGNRGQPRKASKLVGSTFQEIAKVNKALRLLMTSRFGLGLLALEPHT